MTRATCPDCKGACVIECVETDPEGYSSRRIPTQYDCAECEGHGWVEVDPLDGVDDGPLCEPDDAMPEWLAALNNAARVVRGESEAA